MPALRRVLLALVALLALGPALRAEAPAWPCRPAEVALPQGFDPTRIYLASRPSLLPDGSRFLFEWCDAIWIAPVAGGTAKVLQHSTGRDTWPVVSRDGKRFAFQSNRAGGWHVFVADIDEGAEARQIAFNSEGERPYIWSADDSELLCYVLRDDNGTIFDQGRLAWLPVDERAAERQVFDAMGSDPSLSPDGRYLLFVQEGENLYRKGFTGENAARIWCYDTQMRTFALAVKHPSESLSPIWCPDGKGFYYVSGQDGTLNVWWHAFPGTEERQVTFFEGDSVIAPTLSADGRTMVFRQGLWFWRFDPTSPGAAPQRIDLVPEDTGLSRTPTRRRYYTNLWNNDAAGSLDATADGLQFAFTAGGDVYVMDTILREPRLVYGDSRTHEREAVFSRDASRLYILSDRGDGTALLLAQKTRPDHFWWENAAFDVRPLKQDAVNRSMLSVSPDGSRLAWVETTCRIVIADLDGNVIRTFPQTSRVNSYDWAPDGRWLVAAMEDDYTNSDIWILPIDDPDAKPYNLSRSFTWDGTPAWSPDGQLIAWNGQRVGSGTTLFYVWLNRHDEEALKAQSYRKAIEHMGLSLQDRPETSELLGATALDIPDPNRPDADVGAPRRQGPKPVIVDFDDLHGRVHAQPIAAMGAPTFAPDSRRILFPATIGGRAGTYEVTIPDALTPRFLNARWGFPIGWFGKPGATPDRLIMITSDNSIGTFDELYPFNVYQELSLPDYQELAFLSAWRTLRDEFYDANHHGADWDRVRLKYQAPARHAPCASVFDRIIQALNGELNASHLGFYPSEASRREWERSTSINAWEPVTSHLGIQFDHNYTGDVGWMVRRVIPGGPADSAQIDLKPGDLVVSIDGKPIRNGMDPTLLLNGPRPGKYTIEVRSGGQTRKIYIEAITYGQARDLLQKALYADRRDYVHRRSGGAFGYINIAKMNNDEYNRFEREIFAEGFDKAGMIIDVRDNTGGFTADRVLNILGVQRHSWSVPRHGQPAYLSGYWGRPVFDKPIVVLCNQNTVSNGEIFSHAIKQLGRGKLVGVQTQGGVIATKDRPLLDIGMLRQAHYGWYTLDGTDMELHGALPDVIVETTPADAVAGRDPQLDAAIDVLTSEVDAFERAQTPFVPNTYKWDWKP